jgi:hypothetical protein
MERRKTSELAEWSHLRVGLQRAEVEVVGVVMGSVATPAVEGAEAVKATEIPMTGSADVRKIVLLDSRMAEEVIEEVAEVANVEVVGEVAMAQIRRMAKSKSHWFLY